ncbi:MAG: hypothetical protein ACO23H_14120 [Alphaproteobacteria bacterium]
MAGSKGGGGGGKGGSFTPPANQYGGGYGTGYYNPQPRLPQAPYNPMMDVYGSSQNVMQPMMGYYNQFPAAGSNYRPYQPQPQPEPPPSNPTYLPVSDTPVENQGHAFTGDLSSLTNQMLGGRGGNVRGNIYLGGNQEPPMRSNALPVNPELERVSTPMAAPPQFTATRTRPDGYPVSAVNMPILDAADRRGGKGRDSGPRSGYVKYSQPQPQLAPIADPGFGGYDQNARAMMYGAPSIMFGGFR